MRKETRQWFVFGHTELLPLASLPTLLLAIVIAGLLGPSLTNAGWAIGVVYSPTFARVARSSVLSVKNEVYIG